MKDEQTIREELEQTALAMTKTARKIAEMDAKSVQDEEIDQAVKLQDAAVRTYATLQATAPVSPPTTKRGRKKQ